MKFSDNIIRENSDIVFVIRTDAEMEARDEYNSNLWGIEKCIGKDKAGRKVWLFSTPARDVKIGESIYDEQGKFEAYRSE